MFIDIILITVFNLLDDYKDYCIRNVTRRYYRLDTDDCIYYVYRL